MNETLPVPPVPPAKKGMPVIGWVGIGCGTMLIIAVVVVSLLIGWCKRNVGDLAEFQKNPEKATAEMIVKMNPDLEKVSQDDAKGEMTIRTKDGQEMTLTYKDISEGKFTMKDAQGNVTQFGQSDLSNVPAWVPRIPGMKSSMGSSHHQEKGKVSGLYTATSGESLARLEEFFKAEAGKLKLTESSRTSFNTDGAEHRILAYEGAGRTLNIAITAKPGEDAQVNVGYGDEQKE